MQRTEVESSNIKSIWYDESNHILEVEFKDLSIYQYFNVPSSEYIWIMNANSHWEYLNENIKWVYEYEKIM